MNFVSLGRSNQSTIVAQAEAVIGKIFIAVSKLLSASAKFRITKNTGQIAIDAHLCFRRFIYTHSRNIPTKLGIIPPTAPRQK